MFKKLLAIVALLFALSAPAAFMAPALAVHDNQGLQQHCPDHNGHPGKIQAAGNPAKADQKIIVNGQEVRVVINGKTVAFFDDANQPIEVEFCMKAGDLAGGKQTGSAGTVTWTNHGGNVPDISYVVVYAVVGGAGGNGGRVSTRDTLGSSTGGQVTSDAAQVEAPAGAVATGLGGAAGSFAPAMLGLGGSLATLALGALRLYKRD